MKTVTKFLLSIFFLASTCINVFAQETTMIEGTSIPKATAIVETKILPVIQGKEIIVTFKNTCDRPIAIFAGPKENLREPRLQTFGGLSTNNKLYVKENEVVCLMTEDKKPKACVILKPGITIVEVNVSANGISAK